MDSLSLLHRARLAGLKVRADGDQLVVRGRRSQEQLAQELLAHKVEVMAELAANQLGPWPKETVAITADICAVKTLADLQALGSGDRLPGSCYACGAATWWRLRAEGGPWICTRCYPPRPAQSEIESWPVEERRDG